MKLGMTAIIDTDFITAFQSRTLTPAQVREFAALSSDVIVFTLLELMGKQQASQANQPSSTIPPFQKPASPPTKKGKPGAQPGHKGSSRKKPERIDHHAEHELPCCPHCSGDLSRTGDTRTRTTEDMPVDLHFETTEHTIHSDWCPRCKSVS